MADGAHASAAAAALRNAIGEAGEHLSTGLFGSAALLPVVGSVLGNTSLAHAILTQESKPSWYAFLAADPGSTLWETWDGAGNGTGPTLTNSLNHPMFGVVLDYLLPQYAGAVHDRDPVSGAPRILLHPRRGMKAVGHATRGTREEEASIGHEADSSHAARHALGCSSAACRACSRMTSALPAADRDSVECFGSEFRHEGGHTSTAVVVALMEETEEEQMKRSGASSSAGAVPLGLDCRILEGPDTAMPHRGVKAGSVSQSPPWSLSVVRGTSAYQKPDRDGNHSGIVACAFVSTAAGVQVEVEADHSSVRELQSLSAEWGKCSVMLRFGYPEQTASISE